MEIEQKLHIGMKAPDFECSTTFGTLALSDYKGKWLIFFSHPGDFTPVCTTEFLAFASCYDKFKDLSAELLALSIGSNSSHLAWLDNIYNKSGVMIPFPVVADITGEIAKLYSMKSENDTSCVRNVYIIDPSGVIRAILVYPKEIGRNINEILRMLEALQLCDSKNVMIPANWENNMPCIVKPPNTYEDLKERVLNSSQYTFFDWYLCFNKEMGE